MKEVYISNAPYDFGTMHEGGRYAPDALREAGLIESLSEKGVEVVDGKDRRINFQSSDFGAHRSALVVTNQLYARTLEIHESGRFPLTIGGDHSITVGPALATQQYFGKIGLISIDRHTDMQKNYFFANYLNCANVMRVLTDKSERPAGIMNPDLDPIDPKNTAVIGVNEMTEYVHYDDEHMVVTTWCGGIEKAVEEVIACASDGTNGIYLTVDIDALRPDLAPGVNYPGGQLDMAQMKFLISAIAKTGRLLGADLVEVNPEKDEDGITVKSAIEIIGTILESRES